MRLRSLLFVPGDRPDRLQRAIASGADAVIIDLEDSVASPNKNKARSEVACFVNSPSGPRLFIRVNPLSSPEFVEDLHAVGEARPFGIVLPKCEGATDVTLAAEQLLNFGCSHSKILPIATETAVGVFNLGTYSKVSKYLCGLTWGAEDLPAAIGASSSRQEDGSYTSPYEMARSLTLFGAHAASVPAIETVFLDFRNEGGLRAYAARGRRDGFQGMMAIHPDQVPIINEAFTPSVEEIAWASGVVAAFHAQPGVGVVVVDGRMVDRPHLTMAQKILANSR